MIRQATHSDIPQLLDMGEKFSQLANLNSHCGYDPESMKSTFAAMIDGDSFVIFISENGAIGGMIAPHPFNHACLFVDELFWWSEGKGGLRLLEAFEKWADEHGAIVRMTALEEAEPERVGRIYERRGYIPLERAFIRV